MTGMKWAITPLGLLSHSLKRELRSRVHEQTKLERMVNSALGDLKDYMRKNHETTHFTAMVLDGDELRFISVQKSS